jgi:tetratricopeptide (TPR) repeat protein
MTKRRPIPTDVRNKVLVDAMHRCCLCPEHQEVVDLHHVVPISEGGPNTEDNLMAICPTCHAKIHRIRIDYTVDQLRMYKERWTRLCALGLPLDLRMAQAFDVTRPPAPLHVPPGIPPPPTPYVAHPYPAQEHFTGREPERADLTHWLADPAHPTLAVVAIGGMGKSALAWHWLHHDLLPPGLEHWNLRGALWWCFYDRESGFERFLERAIAYASGGEIDATQWPVRDRMECLCTLLAGRRFLVVLDGAERLLRAYARLDAPYLGDEIADEAGTPQAQRVSLLQCADPNVGTFLQWLAGLEATKTLLTTRLLPRELEALAGVARMDLTQMDAEDAVRFFRALGVRKGTRAEIQAACAPYGYLPLALRLLGGLVAEDPARPGDVAVATEYEISDDLRGREHHHILERAYDALDPPARELLSRIAAFRSPVGYRVLQALFAPSPLPEVGRGEGVGGRGEGFRLPTERALKDALRGLLARGLLSRQGETGRYDLHPVVRRYAYDRLADKEGTHARLRDYFAAVPSPERVESLDDLAPAIELYHHTVRAGQCDEAFELFRDRLHHPLYYRFGAYGLCIELLRALFPSGESFIPSGEATLPRLSREDAQAWTFAALANSYSLSGQPGQAVPLFEAQNALQEKAGNKQNLAIGLGNLALNQVRVGTLAAAEGNLRRRITLCREIENESNEAIGHSELGHLLAHTGAFEEARTELKDARKVFDALGVAQTNFVSVVRAFEALLDLQAGYPHSAREKAQQALELAQSEVRSVFGGERDIIRTEWLLGAAHRARGEATLAEPHLDEALRRCRRINMVDHEPDILLELARLRRVQAVGADHAAPLREESLSRAREALDIADRCGYRLVQADAHLLLAQLALDAGDTPEAHRHAEIARERARCDGPPHRYEAAFLEAEHLLQEIESLKR